MYIHLAILYLVFNQFKNKANNRMKITHFSLVFFFVLGSCTPLWAQFAGPDKTVVRTGDNMEVLIGMPDANPYACYQWTGNQILGDNEKPQIRVSPTDSVNIYHVKRVTQSGVEEDEVRVFLTDEVRIDSVKPHHGCWLKGASIDVSDFDIFTTPAGLSQWVRVAQGSTTAKGSTLVAENDTMITFEAIVNGNRTGSQSVKIHVVNSDVVIGTTSNTKIGSISNVKTNVQEELTKVNNAMGVLKSTACVAEPTQQVTLKGWQYKDCGCTKSDASRQVVNLSRDSVSLQCVGNFKSSFPISAATGNSPLLKLSATTNLTLEVNFNDEVSLNDCNAESCVDLPTNFVVKTDLQVSEMHKNVLQSSAQATTNVTLGKNSFCFQDEKVKWGELSIETQGNVSYQTISLVKGNYNLILLDNKKIENNQ